MTKAWSSRWNRRNNDRTNETDLDLEEDEGGVKTKESKPRVLFDVQSEWSEYSEIQSAIQNKKQLKQRNDLYWSAGIECTAAEVLSGVNLLYNPFVYLTAFSSFFSCCFLLHRFFCLSVSFGRSVSLFHSQFQLFHLLNFPFRVDLASWLLWSVRARIHFARSLVQTNVNVLYACRKLSDDGWCCVAFNFWPWWWFNAKRPIHKCSPVWIAHTHTYSLTHAAQGTRGGVCHPIKREKGFAESILLCIAVCLVVVMIWIS